jgi:acyl-CoA dehydrogenase family protein 9
VCRRHHLAYQRFYDDQGVEASGQECYVAACLCNRGAHRVADSDDEQTRSIARLAYNRRGYTPRLR